MASSDLFRIRMQTLKTPTSSFGQLNKTFFSSLSFSKSHLQSFYTQLSLLPCNDQLYKSNKFPSLSINCSSVSSSAPPSSKEEAIRQAKTCLSTTLEKPLNNPKFSVGKLKKLKQPRFQVEIPIIDDSPTSLSELAFDLFKDLSIKRKGNNLKILILWPNQKFKDTATKVFQSSNNVENVEISSIINKNSGTVFGSVEVAVFVAPESSQLEYIKTISDTLYPKPIVILNPKWGFEDDKDYGELSSFVGSFEVVYSFLGLEVQGILSKTKGVVFKCVRDGILSGEKWNVLVEEEGELKVVSKFQDRPSIGEVENVLYNLMAINSPITKSAKFLKNLVSNVTGKK